MKKSVIIIIGVIYVMAIMLVSFMGLQIETFDQLIYVESIEITNTENVSIKDGKKWITFEFDESDPSKNVVQLEWKVTPDNATKKNVKFVCDEEADYVTVNSFGTVIFTNIGIASVQIVSTDGSGSSTNVMIFARRKR